MNPQVVIAKKRTLYKISVVSHNKIIITANDMIEDSLLENNATNYFNE